MKPLTVNCGVSEQNILINPYAWGSRDCGRENPTVELDKNELHVDDFVLYSLEEIVKVNVPGSKNKSLMEEFDRDFNMDCSIFPWSTCLS